MDSINYFREHKPCLNCEKSDYNKVYQWEKNYYDHKKIETCSWDGRQSIDLQVVKCNNCQLVYTNPAFKSEHLDMVYPADLDDDQDDNKNLPFKKKWTELANIISSHLKEDTIICDIGTRYGQFPDFLKKKGYNAFGIDLNPTFVSIGQSKNFPIYEGRIESLQQICKKLELKRINAFVLDDVLEHLCYPRKELEILSSYQQSGDFLFLRQMDYNSLGRKIYGKNWYYFQPAAHMVYFSEETIKPFLDKLGYEVLEIKKSTILESLLYLSKIIIGDTLLFLGIGQLINKVVGKRLVKSSSQYFGGKLNYTSTRGKLKDIFTVIARKK